MKKTVGALFDRFEDAQNAFDALNDAGFRTPDLSLIANDRTGRYAERINPHHADDTAMTHTADAVSAGDGAGFGAVVGAVTGILAGLAAFTVPGIGPIVALGPLAASLTGGTVGAVTGAATGGLVAALIHSDIPEETANQYAEGVRRGGAVVLVQAEESDEDKIRDIFRKFNAIDMTRRTEEWRTSGWDRFDPNAEPYKNAADETQPTFPKAERASGLSGNGSNGKLSVTNNLNTSDTGLDNGSENQNHEPGLPPGFTTALMGTGAMGSSVAGVGVGPGMGSAFAIDATSDNGTATDDESRATNAATLSQPDSRGHTTDLSMEAMDGDFRGHYMTNYGNDGTKYDDYYASYRFGYDLAHDARYKSASWAEVESDAQSQWDAQNPARRWNEVKDAIRYAWDRVRRNV